MRSDSSGQLQRVAPVLWVTFFCYSVCAALVFQKLLLPLFPSMHAGGGLLSNDSVYFNSLAVDIARRIRLDGWSSWQPFQVSGNVAVVGALYALFGDDPAWIIPWNGAIHALGGLLIFLLARELSGKETLGTCAGIVAACLFVLFPSALNWFAQLHKDGYSIAGILLVLLAWVKAVRRPAHVRGWIALVLIHGAGVFMIAFVRPYLLQILLPATLGACIAILAVSMVRRQLRGAATLVMFFVAGSAIVFGGIKVFGGFDALATASTPPQASVANVAQTLISVPITTPAIILAAAATPIETRQDRIEGQGVAGNGKSVHGWQWQNTPWFPDRIERYIQNAVETRVAFIRLGSSVGAMSTMDPDRVPQNVTEAASYLPRALQIALFAPFPSSWFANRSIVHLVATGEMLVYYLCIPGILFLLWHKRDPAVLLSIYFACFFLLALGFSIANLGTLYRMRYAYSFILILTGVLGWFTILDRSGLLKKLLNLLKPPVSWDQPGPALQRQQYLSLRKEAVSSGFLVIILTSLCFLGFFFRDLMMARTFGLGSTLDSFFVALMIPMFIVTVIYMPLGAAFVPIYLDARERMLPRALQVLVSGISSWTGVSLLIACVILYLSGPKMLQLLSSLGSSSDTMEVAPLLRLALPILLFSGIVILGNSILNANGRAVFASAAQLTVPVISILALVLFGDRYGVKSVMYGMAAGQLLNLFLVRYVLKLGKISILPRGNFHYRPEIFHLLSQYWPLVLSALFVSLVIPVAMLMAMLLPDGGVSAFNLGTKVVLFVTGLVGAAMTAVILPYFASMIAKNQLVEARRELSFFLLLATFVSIPVSAGLFLWSEPIVRLIFEGGSFDAAATKKVALVMQYSVLQLPFFVCNALLLKFATATRRVIVISVVTFVGLLVNITAGSLLMKYMGVGGIALGASFSVLVSAALLLLAHTRKGYVTGLDTVIIVLNWLLFITLLMCINFHNLPGVYVIMLSYAVLMAGYVNSLRPARKFMSRSGE